MKYWNGHSVEDANLNAIGDFDAVVDPAFGSDNGAKFGTITAALAAGAKSIFVRPGASTEDVTISTDHVTIIGATRGDSSSGARVKSLTINAEHVTVERITAVSASSHGFTIKAAAHWASLRGCRAYSAAGDGFRIQKDIVSPKLDQCYAQGCDNGFQIDAPDDSSEIQDAELRGCGASMCDGAGFAVMVAGTGTGTILTAHLDGCYAYDNSQAASSAGFYVGANVDATLVGCRAIRNGVSSTTGNGFFFRAPASGRFVAASGCLAKKNANSGFRISAASARVSLTNCAAGGNTVAFMNCASSPGFAASTSYGTNKAV